jgi:hypothetical protein
MFGLPSRLRSLAPKLFCAATLFGLGAWSNTADAAPAGSRSKRFRFHGQTDVFGFTHFNPDGSGAPDINTVGFGFGRLRAIDRNLFNPAGGGILLIGTAAPSWGLGFGFLLLDSQLEIGARFSFAVDGTFWEDSDDRLTVVGGQLVPYVRGIFLPQSQFRPYVEGRFGLGGAAVNFEDESSGTITRGNTVYPVVGIGGGVHMFILESFSFDLGLNFDYFAPHSRSEIDPDVGPTVEEDYEKDGDAISLGIMAGFSVWF